MAAVLYNRCVATNSQQQHRQAYPKRQSRVQRRPVSVRIAEWGHRSAWVPTAAAAVLLCWGAPALSQPNSYSLSSRYQSLEENSQNIPSDLSSADDDTTLGAKKLSRKLDGKDNAAVKKCATTCVASCTRGGDGAPGLGPISVRKEPIVFKEGFRSRSYCLSECTNICYSLKESAAKN